MISRANGLCLDFNTMMVLMLVCRHMLTILRKLGFATYLPIDNNIWLHKGMMFNRLNLVMFVKNYQTAQASCQSLRSQEKICRPTPAPLKSVGPDSRTPGVKSFSKFDGQ